MNRFRLLIFAAILLGMLGAQASAQNVSVYQGNGQLICISCNVPITPGINNEFLQQFAPLWVKVTDNAGNPVSNASVTWSFGGSGQLLPPASTVTTTNSAGLTSIQYTAPFTSGGVAYPAQNTVTATTTSGATATFTLTQTTLDTASQSRQLNVDFTCSSVSPPAPAGCAQYGNISGSAGTSAQPIYVGVFGTASTLQGGITGPIAGVSVKLINFQTGATVTCATTAGADPGSALTDSTGYAVCNPILAGNGAGQYAVMVGGVVINNANYSGFPVDYTNSTPAAPPYVTVPYTTDPTAPVPNIQGYFVTGVISLSVTPAAVGSVTFVSGNNQSANQGQALAAQLVAKVISTTGTAIAGQSVTWGPVSPAGAATLSNTTTVTDANGQVSTNVTFSSTASGTVSIPVKAGNQQAVFTVTALVPTTISGVTKLSGDNQSAQQNAAFANPLVIQVSVSSGSVANQPVAFSITGPGSLFGTSSFTDSSGRAQTQVQAGATPGAIAVKATVGGFSQTFNLTVAAPGPQITPSSFVNGADFQRGSISPCSIATIFGSGLAANLNGAISGTPLGIGALSYTVAGVSITVSGAQAPIYNVANINGQQQVTFQVPCSVQPGTNVPVTVTVNSGSATVNVTVQPASPGVFQSASTANVPNFGQLPIAVVLKQDGTLVSPQNPARVGETVIAFVTGLGPTTPSVGTNALPIFGGIPSNVTGNVIVGIQNAGVPVVFSRLSEDLIGVYLVGFQIPTGTPTGNDVFSVGIVPAGSSTPYYSNPAAIYVQ